MWVWGHRPRFKMSTILSLEKLLDLLVTVLNKSERCSYSTSTVTYYCTLIPIGSAHPVLRIKEHFKNI